MPIVATAVLVGCAAHDHRGRDAQQAARPLPRPIAKLALAPPLAGAGVEPKLALALRERLQAALVDGGLCRQTVAVGQSETDLERCRQLASVAGAELLLVAEIQEARVRFRGRTELAWLNTLFWACGGGYLSNWVHDHDYEFRLRLSLRGIDPLGGETLFEQELPPIVHRQTLNFHERTTSIWPYLAENLWPPTYCPAQWDGLVEHLAQGALDQAARRLQPALREAQIERAYYRVAEEAAPGLRFELRAPRAGARVLRREELALDLVVETADPERHLKEIRLDGALLWPVDVPEGAAVPPRRRYELQCVGLILDQRPLRVEALDDAGGLSWIEIRKEQP